MASGFGFSMSCTVQRIIPRQWLQPLATLLRSLLVIALLARAVCLLHTTLLGQLVLTAQQLVVGSLAKSLACSCRAVRSKGREVCCLASRQRHPGKR